MCTSMWIQKVQLPSPITIECIITAIPWSFIEMTLVKQSMMLEWGKCAEKLRFEE